MSKQWDKDDLLVDLEQSIDRALKERMTDLAGALYRLQGSAKNWCDDPTCGECPLAEKGCITDMDVRVKRLIAEYHEEQKE